MVLADFKQAFLVVSSTARTAPDYPDRGYAGPSGRLDVIARSLLASIIARGTLFIALLLGPPDPPKTLVASSDECRLYSERMAMLEIKRAYMGKSKCIKLLKKDLEELIHELVKGGSEIVMLREDGVDISKVREALYGRKVYVLGAHIDMPSEIDKIISRYVKYKVSIGPISVYTSHAIIYTLWARHVVERRASKTP
ncbi:MAG: hypothetical protein F7C81_04380 [Desulfurococcales archaeon]|nr:hypothetical protein [Desulfurococcales archaeon]